MAEVRAVSNNAGAKKNFFGFSKKGSKRASVGDFI